MAQPVKNKSGTWSIQIMVGGQRYSETKPTKREILEWAALKTTEVKTIKSGRVGELKTLRDALRKYAEEVSPTKRGERHEIIRLAAFEKHPLPLDRRITELTTADLGSWRDARLGINARGSVLRDITLLGSVLETARREWGWIDRNPMRDVRKPANPDHRKRSISGPETRKMLRALGYAYPVRSVSSAVAHAFLLALSSGMRAGEICGLTWANVREDHVLLPMTKNGTPREVPLSMVGRKIIQRFNGWDNEKVVGVSSQSLDALFRKARKKAKLDGFTFHDSRRTAATRISRKVDPLMLCRIMGWKKTDQALTYYAPKVSDLARLV